MLMIPSQSFCFSSGIVTLYFFFLASPTLLYCRHDQRDALLEFKHEFSVNDSNSSPDDLSLSSWNKSSDCCSWKGVKCDANSGEVISLNLSNIPINNSLKPNSGLFKLQHLRNLTLKNCSLRGEIPSIIGNFSSLTKLNLINNNLVGQVPSSLGNLSQLRYLDLSKNQLSGSIPNSLANLSNLYLFYIHDNYFNSTLPPGLSRLHNLVYFGIGENSFSGPFPTSLFTIPSLLYFDIRGCLFRGPIEFGNKSSLSSLKYINIDDNQFDGLIPESLSEFPNLGEIDFSYNNFNGSTPRSLSNLANLYYLDLSGNKLEGEVPGFLWRLNVARLSYNYFHSFGKSPEPPNETNIIALGLNSNSFRGSFPRWICKLTSLHILDISNNSLNGSIPQCFRNSVVTLEELFMQNNKISGIHPDIYVNATNLKAFDISNNKLAGKLPRSLINCIDLKFLNLKSNEIKDEFPFWLGSLPSLNILLLGSNQFYGQLYHRSVSIGFQRLRVIDVSHNDFNGTIPSFYFSGWREMITLNATYDDYMKDYVFDMAVYHSMEMVNKGVETEFQRIRKDFAAIDFSGNRFSGKIPDSIGLLKELRLLNLSGNAFTGNIPQVLVNLLNLEALDLSQNQLSGHIPGDLGSLSFLSTMNFSHNNLDGPLPRGTQFQRQNCSAFKDNPKLFGLEDICGEINHVPNPTPQESEESSEPEEQVISWIAAAIAYVPGVFCGLVIGHIFASHKHKWFMEKFGRNKWRTPIRSTH